MMGAPATRAAFVTGATGFLGRHLVEELCRQGWRVTALCLPCDDARVLPTEVTVALGDITDIESVRAAMPPGPDAVFHLAGNTSTWSRNAHQQYQDNVLGTMNIIDVAVERSAGRLVYTSSISAYGYQPGRRIEEDTPSNVWAQGDNYGKTKLHAEQRIRQAVAERHLSAVILNPVNILGPYDRHNWSRQLILPVSAGTLRALPPGAATWAYVDDVVAAHIAAVDAGRSGENYILGGVAASFKEVVNEIEEILGRPHSRRVTSRAVLRIALWAATAKSRIDGRQPSLTWPQYRRTVGDLLCNDEKARRELGYRRTDLRTMLARTIDWLRHEHLLDGEPAATDGPQARVAGVAGPAAVGSATPAVAGIAEPVVDVADEPRHVEKLRNDRIRVYLATIEPGARTLYHRHHVDTLYVVMAGGLSRSEEPARQRQRSSGGRSLSIAAKLVLVIRRRLTGSVRLPTGAVLMQYHRDFPLTHRLCAAPRNAGPIRMLGIEMLTPPRGTTHCPDDVPGLLVEYRDRHATTYRIRLAPGQSTGSIHAGRPALLVLLGAASELRWLASADDCTLHNPGTAALEALLIVMKMPTETN